MQRCLTKFLLISLIALFVGFIFGGYSGIIGKGVALISVCSSFQLVYRAYKAENVLLLVFFTFMALYAWPAKLYFCDDKLFAAYYQNTNNSTALWVTFVMAFFSILLNLYTKFSFRNSIITDSFYKKNDIIYWGGFLLTAVSILVFRPKGNLYAGDENASGSSMYEYILILFLVLYSYSNRERRKERFVTMLAIPYVIFTILAGSRVSIIMFGFLLLAIKFQQRINIKIAIFFLIFFIWLMNIYGNIRSNPAALLQGDVIEYLNPFASVSSSDFQNSNEADVYWASQRLFLLVEDGELTYIDRLYSFICYCISPILPGSMQPEVANLTQYKIGIYNTGGGGLAPVVFFMYGGFLGVFLLARFVAKRLRNMNCIDGSFASNYSILMVVMQPRWLAYFPLALIKFCIIGALFMYILSKYNRMNKNFDTCNDKCVDKP